MTTTIQDVVDELDRCWRNAGGAAAAFKAELADLDSGEGMRRVSKRDLLQRIALNEGKMAAYRDAIRLLQAWATPEPPPP